MKSASKAVKGASHLPDEPVIDLLWESCIYSGSLRQSGPSIQKAAEEEAVIGGVNVYQRLAESLSSSGAFEEALEWYEKPSRRTPSPTHCSALVLRH
ncbi:hypothetical protein PO124_15975 [Bacillus licheniformis]|nr:hypothetical protein [Bacillus licheniformis]